MKKIPTMFERDWDGDRSRVVNQINPEAQWVADGEGVATRKYDGTACLFRDGVLYKRQSIRVPDGTALIREVDGPALGLHLPADSDDFDGLPQGYVIEALEQTDGRKGKVTKAIGWVPVGGGPEDHWHREAIRTSAADGTYELIGPNIQGNPEGASTHLLLPHAGAEKYGDAPRDFHGLAAWLADKDIEGLVWQHRDGRMAKIKLRDFGLSRFSAVARSDPKALLGTPRAAVDLVSAPAPDDVIVSAYRDPETDEEWQQAIDAADRLLLAKAAYDFGLTSDDIADDVDAERCRNILWRGRERGIYPTVERIRSIELAVARLEEGQGCRA